MEKMIYGNAKTGEVSIGNKRIDISKSRRLVNKSPSGFAWGYHGSGPAQLALAILLEICDKEQMALSLYQIFKQDIIAAFDIDADLSLPVSKVLEWLRTHQETVEV